MGIDIDRAVLCGIRCALGIIIVLLVIVGLFGLIAGCVYKAYAHDHHRPDLNTWYNSLTTNGGEGGSSCCNMHDCHLTVAEIRGEDWWAKVGYPIWEGDGGDGDTTQVVDWVLTEFVKVPKEAILKRDNLVGTSVICHAPLARNTDGVTYDSRGVLIRCFLLPNLS